MVSDLVSPEQLIEMLQDHMNETSWPWANVQVEEAILGQLRLLLSRSVDLTQVTEKELEEEFHAVVSPAIIAAHLNDYEMVCVELLEALSNDIFPDRQRYKLEIEYAELGGGG